MFLRANSVNLEKSDTPISTLLIFDPEVPPLPFFKKRKNVSIYYIQLTTFFLKKKTYQERHRYVELYRIEKVSMR